MHKKLVNVLDYSADPSGKLDCTVAFREAIAAAEGVLVPHGTYKISGLIKGDESMFQLLPPPEFA